MLPSSVIIRLGHGTWFNWENISRSNLWYIQAETLRATTWFYNIFFSSSTRLKSRLLLQPKSQKEMVCETESQPEYNMNEKQIFAFRQQKFLLISLSLSLSLSPLLSPSLSSRRYLYHVSIPATESILIILWLIYILYSMTNTYNLATHLQSKLPWFQHVWTSVHLTSLSCAHFSSTYTKIGTIQRTLTWPLCKDGMKIHEVLHILK